MENRFISRFLFNEICLLNRHSFATPKDASQDRIYSFVNEVYLCLTTMIPFQRCERCYNCVARVGEGNRECKWMARKNKTDPTKCAIILLRTFSFFFFTFGIFTRLSEIRGSRPARMSRNNLNNHCCNEIDQLFGNNQHDFYFIISILCLAIISEWKPKTALVAEWHL